MNVLGFFESQCYSLRCIEGTVWGGGGCTANALELPPPCAEPQMYPDVIEGCTSIGPESTLLSRTPGRTRHAPGV